MFKLNKTTLITATLMATVMVSGCNKEEAAADAKAAPDKAVTTETTQTTTTETTNPVSSDSSTDTTDTADTTAAVAQTTALDSNEDLTVARLTSETIDNQLFIPLIESGQITKEQANCLKGRDKNFAVAEAQAFYKSKFSADELKKLNDFYNSPTGKNLIGYGNEQLRAMNGLEIKNPMPAPSEKELNAMKSFMESDLGKKYQQVNNSEGAGSLVEALQPIVDGELKRCNIQPPNAPAPAVAAPEAKQ